ncbi:MAG: glycosyltransferase [Candidatus Eisenbacteria bacterium]|uniref:Glycosyltransferase n=1 Tax=Eiseniibacteriota bacterium TaxID=2212470 RepID=A0A538SVA6_UNCEI|nr:MAG: glycosyltransferase [Candidatus Eisenbacteria bacterium]
MYQADLLERVEQRLCPRFSLNLMMSQADAARLRALAPSANTVVVPNGVDTAHFKPMPEARAVPGRIVFVGGTAMFPNRDALEYLLRDIWPSICRAQPQASLHVIGSSPAADRARFGSEPCVTVLGLVPDIRPHLAQASCCVVPLRVGGGTRLKILDAWGMGKAVVSTSIGCEGLDAVDDKNILVRDEAGAFADAVVHVLANSELRARLGMNARNTAETHYDWTVVGQGLRREYWRIMNAGRSLPAQLV